MYCTGTEQLFTDIINQTILGTGSTLFENEDKAFEVKLLGKRLVKLNKKTGESWEFNNSTFTWDFMKTERPAHRDPYFAKR